MNEGETGGKVKSQVLEVVKVYELIHLGSAIQSNEQYTAEVKKGVQEGRSGWK